MPVSPDLKTTLKRLKLSPMLATLADRPAFARSHKLDYAEFLELVLGNEAERRQQVSLATRLYQAGFLVFICLKADRSSGRYRCSKDELALTVGMARAQLDGCPAELEAKGICSAAAHEEDGALGCTLRIAKDFWPYTDRSRADAPAPVSDYVARVRRLFVKLGCTWGRFSDHDARLARDWQQRRMPLGTVEEALLLGAVRKYAAWFNSGSVERIASLAYFEAVIEELRQQALPPGYRQYLERKPAVFAGQRASRNPQKSVHQECSAPCPETDRSQPALSHSNRPKSSVSQEGEPRQHEDSRPGPVAVFV